MKRRKGEFATIVVEKFRNRTSQVMCLDLALTTLVAEDDAQIPPQVLTTGFRAAAQQIIFIFRTVVLQGNGLRRLGDHLLQREFFVEHAGKLQLRQLAPAPIQPGRRRPWG